MRAPRLTVLCVLASAWMRGAPCRAQATFPTLTYAPEALQEDIDHLRRVLLREHPAPFMYTTREYLEHCFDSLRAEVDRPMTELRFLSHIAALYRLLGDGHTMFLPSADDADREKRFLPFSTYWDGQHLYVRSNGSDDDRMRPGAELVAINGVPAADILDTLLRGQIRDGRNTTYPTWILNRYFRAYYRYSFGEPDTFNVMLQDQQAPSHLRIAALPADSIRAHIERRDEGSMVPGQGGTSLLYVQEGIAVLILPSFERGNLTKATLDSIFRDIRRRGTDRLILDLRDNQGGEPGLAKELLAHVLTEPFHLVQKGPANGKCRPVMHPYAGKLVVLMNGGSFSATGMVLSCLERHGRATFIGEEAGGNRTVLSGSPKHFRLPNTGLDCYISTRLWQLVDRPNDGHGVLPTIAVSATIEDIVHGRDPVMESALRALE